MYNYRNIFMDGFVLRVMFAVYSCMSGVYLTWRGDDGNGSWLH